MLVAPIDRVGHRQVGRRLTRVRGEVREVLLHRRDAARVIGELAVADAAHLRMHLRAAKLLLADFLTGNGLDEGRPRESEAPDAFDHRHVVREPRNVRRASSARPHHGGYLRNEPAERDLLPKEMTRSCKE